MLQIINTTKDSLNKKSLPLTLIRTLIIFKEVKINHFVTEKWYLIVFYCLAAIDDSLKVCSIYRKVFGAVWTPKDEWLIVSFINKGGYKQFCE